MLALGVFITPGLTGAAVAQSGGTIAGTIVTTVGDPATGADVTFWYQDSDRYGRPIWTQFAQARADAEGKYVSPLLFQSQWQVRFGAGDREYVAFTYPSLVPVADTDAIAGIDATLQRRAAIAGLVSSPGGLPLPGLGVSLRKFDTGSSTWTYAAYGTTDSAGRYRLVGLEPGRYRVQVQGDDTYATRWWPDSGSLGEATDVDVAEGQQVGGIDVQMVRVASISGTLSRADGGSFESYVGMVQACPFTGPEQCTQDESRGVGYLNAAGQYTITGLSPGSYRVQFVPEGSDSPLAYLWWKNASRAEDAVPVQLAAGEAATGIDGVVPRAGSLSGQVLTEAGTPANGLSVELYRLDRQRQEWTAESFASTQYGEFHFAVRRPGEYRVKLSDPLNRFATQWYPSSPTADDAEVLQTGLDVRQLESVTVHPLPKIVGSITTHSGSPISGTVAAYQKDSRGEWSSYFSAPISADGQYELQLDSGPTILGFFPKDPPYGEPQRYVPEYSGDTEEFSAASPIVVRPDQASRTVNAELDTYAQLTCQLTTTGGAYLPLNTGIDAYRWDAGTSSWVKQWAAWASSGGYCQNRPVLRPGRYKFHAWPYEEADIEPRWSGEATSLDTAEEVVVPDGGTFNLDLQLPRKGAPETLLPDGPNEGAFWLGESASFHPWSQERRTTFRCSLDGVSVECGNGLAQVSSRSGRHDFTAAAVGIDGEVDPTPAVRSWVSPLSAAEVRRDSRWSLRTGRGYYRGTYVRTSVKGATLTANAATVRRISLVATRSPGAVVKVFLGSTLLRKVNLGSSTTRKMQVVPVANLDTARTGKLRVVVASDGVPVTIEGVGLAS